MPRLFLLLYECYRFVLFKEFSEVARVGTTKVLEESDLPALNSSLCPRKTSNAELAIPLSSPWGFHFGLLKLRPGRLGAIGGLIGGRVVFALASPVLIYHILQNISAATLGKTSLSQGLLAAILLASAGLLSALANQHLFYQILSQCVVSSNVLNIRLYRFSLNLKSSERTQMPVGDVVNLMSTDSEAVSDFLISAGEILYSFFILLGVTFLLFKFLGAAAPVALFTLFLLSPLTQKAARKFTELDSELMAKRDARVTLMSQILSGIRVVKYFGWRTEIQKEVTQIRESELAARQKLVDTESLATLLYASSSTILCVVAYSVSTWLGHPLPAPTLFACLALFSLLEEPFGEISMHVSAFSLAKVSLSRIEEFLQPRNCASTQNEENSWHEPVAVKVKNLSVRHEGSEDETLKNVSFQISAGKCVAVVGAVGSGKSTLLLALLGELKQGSEQVTYTLEGKSVRPRLAYVPQEAFVMNASLRENILFGENDTHLHEALHFSALQKDLELFPKGIFTEVGEHGVNLSGGQKQRLSLARAVVRQPGLVLLDDPFSAVDEKTEDFLAQELLFRHWKDVTRIVVTHRLAHLQNFDSILYFRDGKLEASGNYTELMLKSSSFRAFCRNELREIAKREGTQVSEIVFHSDSQTQNASEDTPEKETERELTGNEHNEKGAVKRGLYWKYFSALAKQDSTQKPAVLGGLLVLSLVSALAPLAQRMWLSHWSATPQLSVHWALGVFTFLSLAVLATVGLEKWVWLRSSLHASRSLHEGALRAVLSAPLHFFDSNPQGRILNRFSRDADSLDRQLPFHLQATVRCIVLTLVAIGLLLSVLPWAIVALVPMLYLYFQVSRSYRCSAREIKRMDSLARSPRASHFKETLVGLAALRSHSSQNYFEETFFKNLEKSQRFFYCHFGLNRWFSTRVPIVGSLLSVVSCVGIIWASRSGHMSVGVAGVALSYALGLWESLNFGIRAFSVVEANLTSVERLNAYAQLMPEPLDGVIPPGWPCAGKIEFKDVYVRYAEHFPPVLKGVSFSVAAGSKVGIVGRTGAGKSTLLQALYRFVEASHGEICIDGFNIAHLPLDTLRSALAIIPQDPTLFMGTLRINLDRFSAFTDAEIWHVLSRAHLQYYVQNLPGQLDAVVLENGSNFSQGQRQLICLARALLCRAKIIVLDEATASVDLETDAALGRTLREECADLTVLVIAHRLETLAECDAIVELADGKVVQQNRPTQRVSLRNTSSRLACESFI